MKPDLKGKFTIRNRYHSFRYAFKGIFHLLRYEHNSWIQSSVGLAIVIAGIFLHFSRMEWVAVVICIGMVLAAEIFNTAIELLVDLVSPEYHPLAGKVKDLAAGGVLICSGTAFATGLILTIPKLIALFQ